MKQIVFDADSWIIVWVIIFLVGRNYSEAYCLAKQMFKAILSVNGALKKMPNGQCYKPCIPVNANLFCIMQYLPLRTH